MDTDLTVTGSPTGSPTGDPTSDSAGTTSTSAGTTSTSAGTTTTTDTGGGPRPTCDAPAGGTLGNVNIESVADLAMLEGIGTITGSLWIHDSVDITNLDPAICVTSIGGDLNLYNNDALTSVAGLDNIETIGGSVIVSDHDVLPSFDTIGKVYEIESWSMNDNGGLVSVKGQTTLEVIRKHLTIQYNDTLADITGLNSLKAIGGNLQVTNNPELCTSQVNNIGAGLEQGPNLDGSSTASNKDC